MNKGIITFLFVNILATACWTQELYRRNRVDGDGVVQDWYMDDYTDYAEYVSVVDGKKHGLSQTIGEDSTVYISGQYQRGVKTGPWRVNYPDGRIRYEIQYDSLGEPMMWSRYYSDVKIISVKDHRPRRIEMNVFNTIEYREAKIFRAELLQCETKMLNLDRSLGRAYFQYDVPEMLYNIADYLIREDSSCLVSTFRYPEGMMYTECLVGNNHVKSKKVFFYKKDKLKKIDYYRFNKLIKTESYDKEGMVSKVKEYN